MARRVWYCCGRRMKRLYERKTVVRTHHGILGDIREYRQPYAGFAWLCEHCGRVIIDHDGKPDEHALVPFEAWERAKKALIGESPHPALRELREIISRAETLIADDEKAAELLSVLHRLWKLESRCEHDDAARAEWERLERRYCELSAAVDKKTRNLVVDLVLTARTLASYVS